MCDTNGRTHKCPVSLNRSIRCLGQSKEGANETRRFLHPYEVGKDHPLQVVGTGYGLSLNPMMFQVVPALFVWVELR